MKILHALAAIGLLFGSPVFAQQTAATYPNKPVKIIVPYPAGGVADLLPRVVGEKLSQMWKQPVVIENKPGASGNIGMELGARAEPDGYTLTLAPTGNLTVNPILFPNLPFNPQKDFAPITVLAASPNVLVVHPSVPAKTLKELIDYAKANPGKLNYASPGEGQRRAPRGRAPQHRGGDPDDAHSVQGLAPAVTDLLAGNVQMMFAGISTVLQHVNAGQARGDRRGEPARCARCPTCPRSTRAASRFRRDVLVRPRGARRHAARHRATIRRDSDEGLSDQRVREKLAELGLDPIGNRPRTSRA
jgi:tripartite-type tricarboxylate transporter receptor subunit TctC